jgi:kumamolisin
MRTNLGTNTIEFRGTVNAMEQEFQVKLFNYAQTDPSENYVGRVGKIYAPKAAEGLVTGVFGLDSRRIARRKKQSNIRRIAKLTSDQSSWYTPSELAAHYFFPDGDGKGQTVGLLEFGGAYIADDLKQFCKLANISPVPEVKAISVDGTPTNDTSQGEEGEVMLDVEIVAGICPKADIVLYFAGFSERGWITALDTAYSDQDNDPGVISASWGLAEGEIFDPQSNQGWTLGAMQHVNDTLQKAAIIGVTICVASGDDGSSDAYQPADGLAHVDFPASSPYVLSIGGTAIPTKEGNQPDIAWKEGDGLRPPTGTGGSTGGGVSSNWLKEDLVPWQKNIQIRSINPGNFNGRVIPDLAANADPNVSPYLVVVDGQVQASGRTSASSPLVAGLLTLINAKRPAGKRVGFLTPVLYQGNPTVGAIGCTDVVSGDNDSATVGGYSAGPAGSGWGTPNGEKLAGAFAKAIPP